MMDFFMVFDTTITPSGGYKIGLKRAFAFNRVYPDDPDRVLTINPAYEDPYLNLSLSPESNDDLCFLLTSEWGDSNATGSVRSHNTPSVSAKHVEEEARTMIYKALVSGLRMRGQDFHSVMNNCKILLRKWQIPFHEQQRSYIVIHTRRLKIYFTYDIARLHPDSIGGFRLIARTTADDTTIFDVRHFHYLLILRLLIELYNNYK
jgi:hypothetical protein